MIGFKQKQSFIAFNLLFVIMFIVFYPTIVAIIKYINPNASDVLSATIEAIPFAPDILKIIMGIINDIYGTQTFTYSSTANYFTFSYVVNELGKLIICTTIYELLATFGEKMFGFFQYKGILNFICRIEYKFIIALGTTILALLILQLIQDYILNIITSTNLRTLITSILTILLGLGVGAIFHFILGFTILNTIIKIVLQFLLIGSFKLLIIYASILMLVLFSQMENVTSIFKYMALSIIMMIIGISMLEYFLGCILDTK